MALMVDRCYSMSDLMAPKKTTKRTMSGGSCEELVVACGL